jgi:hypothetical protein
MSTMTDDPGEAQVAAPRDAELVKLCKCTRCKLPYMHSKSTSALKLTYCSFLCELGDLGFSIIGLENMERAKKPEAPEPVAVGAD